MIIKTGNFKIDVTNNPEKRGWVVGTFIEKDSLFHSDDFEVKWAEHKKGYSKEGLKANEVTKTVVFVVYGVFKLKFHGNNGAKKIVYLRNLGDYVAYDASEGSHMAEALEDCLVVVFRWPSRRT